MRFNLTNCPGRVERRILWRRTSKEKHCCRFYLSFVIGNAPRVTESISQIRRRVHLQWKIGNTSFVFLKTWTMLRALTKPVRGLWHGGKFKTLEKGGKSVYTNVNRLTLIQNWMAWPRACWTSRRIGRNVARFFFFLRVLADSLHWRLPFNDSKMRKFLLKENDNSSVSSQFEKLGALMLISFFHYYFLQICFLPSEILFSLGRLTLQKIKDFLLCESIL